MIPRFFDYSEDEATCALFGGADKTLPAFLVVGVDPICFQAVVGFAFGSERFVGIADGGAKAVKGVFK